jgi:hypothetical protein
MENRWARTELGPNGHFANDLLGLGAEELDAEKSGERQGLRLQSCQQVHSSPPMS